MHIIIIIIINEKIIKLGLLFFFLKFLPLM